VPAEATMLYALLGKPVAGNPTQEMLEAAFAAAGIDARYVSLEVEPQALEAAVAGARALGVAGFHVTVPHKVRVATLVDRLTPAAELCGAVNCVKREGGELVGDNTDGRGFVESLRRLRDPAGAEVAVFGGGGAARAVAAELALAGAARVTVAARRLEAADEIARGIAHLTTAASESIAESSTMAYPGADVLVQATTVGMADPDERLPLWWPDAPAGAIAADVVIHRETAFLRDAAAHGYAPLHGLGMLVEQAAIGFRWWTGVEADRAAMEAALG
jgi:shikimate dehydrogenase